MYKLKFSVIIDAPREKVWNIMISDETYRIWTEVFQKGSHFVGDWNEGSKIHFLAPNEEGKMYGMVSFIKENREFEYISIKHLGFVADGKEDTASDIVKSWAGLHENYTFTGINGKTELLVESDTLEEFKEMFETNWPISLQKIKELSEDECNN